MRRLLLVLLLCVPVLGADTKAPDAWSAELALEHAMASTQHDATTVVFHRDFLGVDTDGSTYAADTYFAARGGEREFARVEMLSYPGAAVIVGILQQRGTPQRFSHIWMEGSGEWRLLAAQASALGDEPNAPNGPGHPPGGDQTTFITGLAGLSDAEIAVVDAFRGVQRAEHAPDATAFAALTEDQFWVIGPDGRWAGKELRVTQVGHQTQATPFPTVHDVQVRIYGDLAVMRGIQEPVIPAVWRFTRLWVRRSGVWRQALNHQTATDPVRK
jgi:hypothetical protein